MDFADIPMDTSIRRWFNLSSHKSHNDKTPELHASYGELKIDLKFVDTFQRGLPKAEAAKPTSDDLLRSASTVRSGKYPFFFLFLFILDFLVLLLISKVINSLFRPNHPSLIRFSSFSSITKLKVRWLHCPSISPLPPFMVEEGFTPFGK